MHIALLIRKLDVGGAERQLINIARGLVSRGHRVTIYVFYSGGALESELTGGGVTLKSLEKSGRWDLLRFAWRFVNQVRRDRPDALYGFLPTSNLLMALLRRFLPPVRMAWGVRASNMLAPSYDWFDRVINRLERRLASRADVIIVNSRAGIRAHVALGYPKSRLVFVPNGIDASRFVRDEDAGKALRSEWGVPRGAHVIGAVGRLDPMKGHEVLLSALAELQVTMDIYLIVMGSGSDERREQLKRLASRLNVLDRVKFLPGLPTIEKVYSAFDLVCVASIYGEGFSNVLCEAMLCGCPCVGTDVGDTRWVIGDDRNVVPPQDVEGLCGALRSTLQRLPSESRSTLRDGIAPKCSMRTMIEATEAALAGD